MSILSRHYIRSMVFHAALLAMALVTLPVAMDLMANFDEFMQAGRKAPIQTGVALGVIQSIAGFYGPLALALLTIFGGWCVTGGMIFATLAMIRHGELSVLPATGIPLRRAALWALLTGAAIQLGLLAIQEWVIPRHLAAIARDQADVKIGGVKLPINMARSREGWLISGLFDATEQTLAPLSAILINPEGRIINQVNAASARWDESRRAWMLDKGAESPRLIDAPPRRQDIRDLPSLACSLDPLTLLANSQFRVRFLLGFGQIARLLPEAGPSLARHLRQLRQSRLAFPIVNLLTLLFAAAWMLHREPGQLERRATVALLATPCLWLATVIVIYAPIDSDNPAIIIWPALVILAAIAADSLTRMNT